MNKKDVDARGTKREGEQIYKGSSMSENDNSNPSIGCDTWSAGQYEYASLIIYSLREKCGQERGFKRTNIVFFDSVNAYV
jgi:hypothetical protein